MNVSTVSLSCRFTVCPKETDAAKIVVMKIRMCRIMLAYNVFALGVRAGFQGTKLSTQH
jgi:hypothetical protein